MILGRVLGVCVAITILIAYANRVTAQDLEPDSLDKDYGPELPRVAATEPAEALATFQVQPGFRVEQVAAEPLVTDPVAMAFDERGRAFVVEMRGYSEDGDKGLGEVRLLEDVDGDGRFDRGTTFLDNLSWPTAIACYDGGVLVGAAPDILYCKDTDGDGRADVREVVFTGFGRQNVQGLMNSFHWGLDNRIHGSASHNGGEIRQLRFPSVPTVSLRGRDFAIEPKTMSLTATSGGGQHGMSFDRWGNKYVSSNSDHIQLIMYEDAYVARNPFFAPPPAHTSIAADGPAAEVFRISPVEPWRIVRTRLRVKGIVQGIVEGGGRAAGYFTGATGVTIYRGDAFPASYQDNAFVGDVGGNLVHHKVVEPDGIGRIARRAREGHEFVASSDIWFRPVQMANAPDGTLYVLDMYREVIEHPLSLPPVIKKHLDLTSGRDRGRIYRIVPEGFVQPRRELPGDVSTDQLVRMLEHPNGWHRETASRLIYERQPRALVPPLDELASGSKTAVGRIQAIHALAGLDALSSDVLSRALRDEHPRVREHAIRVAERVMDEYPAVREKLYTMVDDDDIRVRYQLAFTLGELHGQRRNEALAKLSRRDAGDRWMRVAIFSSLADGKLAVFDELTHKGESRPTESRAELLAELVRQIAAEGNEPDVAATVRTIEKLAAADPTLSQRFVKALIDGGRRHGDAIQRILAKSGSGRAGQMLADLLKVAQRSAIDTTSPLDRRVDAVGSLRLAPFADVKTVLGGLLDPHQPPQVQMAAIRTIGAFRDASAADLLLDAWPAFSPRLRAEALESIFSRRAWIEKLLDRVEANILDARDVDSSRAELLRSHSDVTVRQRAVRLLAPTSGGDRNEVLEAYRSALSVGGDPMRGRDVFRRVCASCHRLEQYGHEVGPNLVTMKNRGPETILVNTLDPNREVDPRYENYVVITEDGRMLSGIIASETATSINLVRAENATDAVLRIDVEQIRGTGKSIMPEGLEKEIEPRAMSDLVAYLLAMT